MILGARSWAVHELPVMGVRCELLISLEESIAITLILNYTLENGTAIPSGY